MGIDFRREEYEAARPEWQMIDRVCDEKDLGELLIYLNPNDKSAANEQRNRDYRDRASWFGAAAVTLNGLIGIAFDDDPGITLPTPMEYLRRNANGEGLDLQQLVQRVVEQVMRKGRVGLFATYPRTEGPVSMADQEAGKAVATLHVIDAKRIINWWTIKRGAQTVLAGVVFTDTDERMVDFEVKREPVLRELSLDEAGMAIDRTWRKPEGEKDWVPDEPILIVDGRGARVDELPFQFVGAVDNASSVDRPPMLALARMNRDHYRNSADHEESLWYAGQVQPYLEPGESGVHIEDLKKAKEDGFYIGSREILVGKIGFAQAEPNSALRQAMVDKIEAMKGLGARLVEPGSAAKTATQSVGEQKVQHSVLSLVLVNVEDGINWGLRWAARFMNVTGEASVVLSRDFMQPEVTVEIIDRVISLLDRVAIGYADALPILKRARLVDQSKTEDEYLDEVEARGGMVRPPGPGDNGNAA